MTALTTGPATYVGARVDRLVPVTITSLRGCHACGDSMVRIRWPNGDTTEIPPHHLRQKAIV
ncbi:hypothetical protein QSJ18_18390 [Gordonia sp. ABSL1-1]|uniref:hypothetical protein n=1 Tax=Gordonia sp. ABSL1-1 TaxID=3053923 RepID=UPI0025748629|nr:hypothetical protein [Gordonia sp. ABSL1-1]MDL9938720.1 hypothetical protein [Gordonia sp. ABSL1-1]